MAKIALQKIIWHSDPVVDRDGVAVTKRVHGVESGDPDLERVVIPLDGVVPKLVPLKVQEQWLANGWVRDDPNIAMPDRMEGPPDMLLPVQPNPPPHKTQINKLASVS